MELQVPDCINILHKQFKNAGMELFLVGGSVRDHELKMIPEDFDLATNATADQIISILGNLYELDAVGKAFGVVMVFPEEISDGIEIATFREDLTIGRNPLVKQGSTIDKDVERRDFTCNALFYDLQHKVVIDLVGGKADIQNKILRMVGNPLDRIKEDKLRVLRAFRFASRFNFTIESELVKVLKANNTLDEVSPERIWKEFSNAFKQSPDFNVYLNLLTEFNMWEQIFPGLNINTDFRKSDDLAVVMANLLRFNAPDTIAKILIPLGAGEKLINHIVFLMNFLDFKKEEVVKYHTLRSRIHLPDHTLIKWLELNQLDSVEHYTFVGFNPIIDSFELMSKGFHGPALGQEIVRIKTDMFHKMLS